MIKIQKPPKSNVRRLNRYDVQGFFQLIGSKKKRKPMAKNTNWEHRDKSKIERTKAEKRLIEFELMEITRRWEEIVGKSLAMHSIPEKIIGNKIYIKTDHSIFFQELKWHSETILKKIRVYLGTPVEEVKIKISQLKWTVVSQKN